MGFSRDGLVTGHTFQYADFDIHCTSNTLTTNVVMGLNNVLTLSESFIATLLATFNNVMGSLVEWRK